MNLVSFVDGVFGRVLEATFSASVLAAIVAVVQLAVGRRLGPAWRHALWIIVLIRLLVPVLPESRLSVFNAPYWLSPSKPEKRFKVELIPTVVAGETGSDAAIPASDLPIASPGTSPNKSPITARQICAAVWLSASAVMLLRLAAANVWLRCRLSRSVVAADPNLARLLVQARIEMRTRYNPRPVETSCVDTPGVFGVLRPRILLPPGMAAEFSEADLRHVLLHELAHLKRGDLWVNLAITIAQVLHWFNPVAWFVLRRMRLERELACDALVLRSTPAERAQSYGQTILKLLERVAARPSFAPVVGILEEKHSAASRLKQISVFQSGKRPSRLLGCVFVTVLALAGLSNAQTKRQPAEDSSKTSAPNGRTGVERLQAEYDLQRERVEKLEKLLEDARMQLKTSANSDFETVRALEIERTRPLAQHLHFQQLHHDFAARGRSELRKVIPTAAPDPAMDRYLADLGKAEQQYASKLGDFGPEHPEIVKLKALIATINKQIEERIDGVLSGLDLQARQNKAVADELEKKINAAREQLKAQNGTKSDEYFQFKGQLENEQRVLDTLYMRLLSEKVDAKVGLENTVPPQSSAVGSSPLVRDARLLMELGKLDEAEAKLKEELLAHPDDRAAAYYLKLVKERRSAQESRARQEREIAAARLGETTDGADATSAPEKKVGAAPEQESRSRRKYGNSGRGVIRRKLDETIIAEYGGARELSLSEVLKELGRSARDIDPNKIGVNFVISSAEPIRKGAEDDSYAWVDGATGQSAARRAKLEDFRVIIDPPLRNATLREILDTIVKVAKPPAGANPNAGIAYSIEDYAVVFHRAAPPALYTRTFRVNPNLFLRNFESATNTTVIEAIRKFMVGAGIDFGPEAQTDQSDQNGKPGQKAMFYNHKTGALMVRASLQDLDKIENALQRLSMSPPQVTIDARFIEFESGAEKQKEMLLGSMHTNVNSVFTLSQFMNDQQFQTVIKALDRGTAVQNAQAGPALIGILTARQRDRILNKLKKADGVTMADAPRVTTLSGRGAVISVEPGPAIAVLPEIEADRKTIRLSAEIQMPGNPKQGERVAKMGAKERLWDGQTLVLQPLDGENQNKVILITPTQVDPAGNRVVQEADIPEGVPQQ